VGNKFINFKHLLPFLFFILSWKLENLTLQKSWDLVLDF